MSDGTFEQLQLEIIGEILVVRLAGWKVPMEVGKPLYDLVEKENHRQILVDFSKVTYMSSTAIAVFVSLKKRLDAVGGTLKFCRINSDLVELLRHTGVDRIFAIYPQEIDALAAF